MCWKLQRLIIPFNTLILSVESVHIFCLIHFLLWALSYYKHEINRKPRERTLIYLFLLIMRSNLIRSIHQFNRILLQNLSEEPTKTYNINFSIWTNPTLYFIKHELHDYTFDNVHLKLGWFQASAIESECNKGMSELYRPYQHYIYPSSEPSV